MRTHSSHTARPFSLTHITNSAGDRLLVIDGVNVEGKKPAEVSSMIVGPSVSEHKHLTSNYSPNARMNRPSNTCILFRQGSSIELSIHSKRTGFQFSVNIVRGSQAQAGVGILLNRCLLFFFLQHYQLTLSRKFVIFCVPSCNPNPDCEPYCAVLMETRCMWSEWNDMEQRKLEVC